jgi:hypothetical protein
VGGGGGGGSAGGGAGGGGGAGEDMNTYCEVLVRTVLTEATTGFAICVAAATALGFLVKHFLPNIINPLGYAPADCARG